MSKGKGKSIRFEERLQLLIEGKEGNSFSDKLETILTEYFSEERELYLNSIEESIKLKLETLKSVTVISNEELYLKNLNQEIEEKLLVLKRVATTTMQLKNEYACVQETVTTLLFDLRG